MNSLPYSTWYRGSLIGFGSRTFEEALRRASEAPTQLHPHPLGDLCHIYHGRTIVLTFRTRPTA